MKSREERRHEAVIMLWWAIGVVAVLFFCLIIIDEALVSWLNTNSGAVIAMVTAVYTFFTLLLWHATKTQAEITRRAFEAGHRPYGPRSIYRSL